MKQHLFSVLATVFMYVIAVVNGHGRLLEPPSRSSMFRFAYSDSMLVPYRNVIQANYDDNQLYCGGKQVQTDNGGKCGVCGDPYHVAVKDNEAGGKYALGIITRKYQQGQLIDVTVEITAAHLGYFEFRLCPWNNIYVPVTHDCLNQNILLFEDGESKWYLPKDSEEGKGFHNIKVRLPQYVTCDQCLLQWRYRTGNSWGTENGETGMGIGQQEEFYGCSDISISAASQQNDTNASPSKSSTTTTTTASSSTSTVTLSTTSTPAATSTTTSKEILSTTETSEVELYPDIDCAAHALGLPIFRDCHSFYICSNSKDGPFVFACPGGTFCDPKSGYCLNEYQVPRCI